MLLRICCHGKSQRALFCAGVFVLLNAYALLKYLQTFFSKSEMKTLFFGAVAGVAGFLFLAVVVLTYAGEL